jgi:hypothetical protein
MAAQLPFPYPDELFYSVFARHFAYFPPAKLSSALRAVVGKRWCSFGFGSGVDRIAERTKYTWGMESHEIIERHTLLPYYGAFLEPKDYLKRVQLMGLPDQNWGNFASSIARFLQNGVKRYCPLCVSKDLAELGETYWRRSHQLFGVTICTVHNQVLFECEAGSRADRSAIHDATNTIAANGGSECASFTEAERRIAIDISRRCVAILNGESNKWTRYEVGPSYVRAAKDLGFNFGWVKTDVALLLARFNRFFDPTFLERIGFEGAYGLKSPFRPDGAKSPLTNVLVQMFFEDHLEQGGFKGFPIERSVYGWKCPNRRANHPDDFRLPSVQRVKSRLGFNYFTARCSCHLGFSFYKASDEDPLMPEISNVRMWSHQHYEEAQKLFRKYLNVSAVAKAMNVSHRTASKLIAGTESAFGRSPEEVEELRGDWERHPSRATYQSLLKHDREWLLERRKQDGKVVVELPLPPAQDGVLAEIIREAINGVWAEGKKLNMTTISKKAGFRIVRTHLEEYPLSKAEVLAVCPIASKRAGAKKPSQGDPGAISAQSRA